MTENVQEQKTASPTAEAQERNFANLRKALEEERREKQELAERIAKLESSSKKPAIVDDDDDSDPYVDNRRLEKKLGSFEAKMQEKIEREAEQRARRIIEEERQQSWMKQNPDFYDVMQHAQKLADQDPETAEVILRMPDTFDRQKLVYRTIKSMGIHKPPAPKETIQDKVNNNRKGVYYQPADTPTAPYSITADYSPASQEAAYKKLQALKQGMRGF